jgi:copper transport protein
MVGIATVNRLYLTPRLLAPGTMRSLERNSLAETGLGFCVLLFVGALGTLSPSGHAHSTTADVPPNAAFVHIHTSEAMAEVTITPGRTGEANATIRVLREDFSEFPAKDVQLGLDPPGNEPKIVRDAAHLPDGTARVTIAPETGRPLVLDAPIEIGR